MAFIVSVQLPDGRIVNHGDRIIGTIIGDFAVGRLCIDGDRLFFCQNTIDGGRAPELFGYKGSWYFTIVDGRITDNVVISLIQSNDKNPMGYLERCEEEAEECSSIGGGLVEFAKNIVLSSDEKLLRKYGLKNRNGEYTSQARVIVEEKLLEDNKEYLISIAQAKAEEEKKK